MRVVIFKMWVLFVVVSGISGCVPVFSELQSARTAGAGNIEVLPSTSSVEFKDSEGTKRYQAQYTIQAAYGITASTDIRLRYEYVIHEGVGGGTNVFGFGPKFALVKDKVAVSLMMGSVFGENTKETWQLHSSLLLTFPVVKNIVEINLLPKHIRQLHTKENLYALNIGFSASNDLAVWSLRTEYGILYSEKSGNIKQFSLGFSKVFEL